MEEVGSKLNNEFVSIDRKAGMVERKEEKKPQKNQKLEDPPKKQEEEEKPSNEPRSKVAAALNKFKKLTETGNTSFEAWKSGRQEQKKRKLEADQGDAETDKEPLLSKRTRLRPWSSSTGRSSGAGNPKLKLNSNTNLLGLGEAGVGAPGQGCREHDGGVDAPGADGVSDSNIGKQRDRWGDSNIENFMRAAASGGRTCSVEKTGY